MKNKEKRGITFTALVITILIVLILAGGIVYAAVSASQINYTTNKNNEIQSVEGALNDLYSKLPTKTLLWTNSNPNDNFSGQTITLNSSLSNYEYVIVQWKFKKSEALEHEDIFKIRPYRLDGDNNSMYTIGGMENGIAWIRLARTINEQYNKIKFGNATSNAGDNDNSYSIPVAIYGLNFSY